MGANSKIEWTDHTFNPWIGCSKVHTGCAHCYAESLSKRTGKAVWGPVGTRVKTSEANWRLPLKWHREAQQAGTRRRVFCASLADVFEAWDGPVGDHHGHVLWHRDDVGVCEAGETAHGMRAGDRLAELDDLRRDLFVLIDQTPQLDWLLLTKRPENVSRMMPCPLDYEVCEVRHRRPNVSLGTSVSNRETAVKMIAELRRCRDFAARLFLSIEPLVDDLGELDLSGIDWVIVGGESGPGARPMHPNWVRSIRDQCVAAGVPFFFKQWGEWSPGEGLLADERAKTRHGFICPGGCFSESLTHDALLTHSRLCQASRLGGPLTPMAIYRLGKKQAGRLLDGRQWDEMPRTADMEK